MRFLDFRGDVFVVFARYAAAIDRGIDTPMIHPNQANNCVGVHFDTSLIVAGTEAVSTFGEERCRRFGGVRSHCWDSCVHHG